MIYTVTCNPSLDHIVTVEDFRLGALNRTGGELIVPGGKGINVSMVLKNLGMDSMALGFSAGYTGEIIERLLWDRGVRTDFVRLPCGLSRLNVKLKTGECETEINGQGPCITEDAMQGFYRKLDSLGQEDILVLAGSIPGGMPTTLYRDILAYLADRGLKIVVDATGELLTQACGQHPFLVKPNREELEQIFDTEIDTREDAAEYGSRLLELGAQNVLVSMGGDGAILLTGDGRQYYARPPKGEVVNTVGAGDSMVAGFLAGFLQTGDMGRAFLYGLCTGSASAYSAEMAQKQQVEQMLKTVQLCDISGEPDLDEVVRMLDDYAMAGGSRMKIETAESLPEGDVHRQYHHGRCDVGSPWACGVSFDVLE